MERLNGGPLHPPLQRAVEKPQLTMVVNWVVPVINESPETELLSVLRDP